MQSRTLSRKPQVVALQPAGPADAIVREGIRSGWQYQPLPRTACFSWRVRLHFKNVLPNQVLPGVDIRR